MKKSIVISLLTVATLLCTALYSFASTGKVTTDTLRLRKEASTDSETIALLSVNDEVEILGEDYGWYKVKSGEKVGYVAAQYINVLVDKNQNIENTNKDDNNTNELNTNAEVNTSTENNQNVENTNPENNEKTENTEKQTKKVITVGQKIYITPLINSLVIKTIEEEAEIEIVSEISGWSYIKIGTTSGWVRTENIETKEVETNTSNPENNNENSSTQKIGYISGNSVNFRKTPNTSGEIIKKLARNTKVTIIEQSDGWAEIECDGNRGYVSLDYISDKEIETTSRSSVTRTGRAATTTQTKKESKKSSTPEQAKAASKEPKVTGSFTGSDVVAYAKKYLGCKYVYGGNSPSGFDCSGFTSYVYSHFGVSLSRTSSGQASNGRAVSKSELAVGDIVCFSSSSKSKKIGHVGIYIGGGKFIHAANSRKGVITSNVTGAGYYFVTARRVI